jgi:hypothetical protein
MSFRLSELPALPPPIRAMRDAVVVMAMIAIGGYLSTLAYEPGMADPVMEQVFNAVFGTMGFTMTAYWTRVHRARHLAFVTVIIWLILGLSVTFGPMPPTTWVMIPSPVRCRSSSPVTSPMPPSLRCP